LEAELDGLCAAYFLQGCKALGREAGRPWVTPDASLQRMSVAPELAPLVRRLLTCLQDGAARRRARTLNITAAWRSLLSRQPSLVAELTLIERMGRNLPCSFAG